MRVSAGQPKDDRAFGCLLVFLTILAIGYFFFERAFLVDDPPPKAPVVQQDDPFVTRSNIWVPAAKATLTPGMQTLTNGQQCTTNFVFTDAANRVYLGQAAHCAGTTGEINGCKAPSLPLDTLVTFHRGATQTDAGRRLGTGRLAYSSWLTMQKRGEKDRAACAFNDFALVKLSARVRLGVNPSLPYWGGPNGLSMVPQLGGQKVYGVGRSSLRKAQSIFSRQQGNALYDQPEWDGWAHRSFALSPGIPGDSGSGYLDQSGAALGTLSTLTTGRTWTNTLGDLRRELEYARKYSGIKGLRMELGTVPFTPRGTAPAPW